MTDAFRWRGLHVACVVVLVASGAVTFAAYRFRDAVPARAAAASASSSPPVTVSPAAAAPAAGRKPTRANLCTFLTAADFAAVGVPSPRQTLSVPPGSRGPQPGQMTCAGRDTSGYAVFWSNDTAYEAQRYANQRATRLAAGWVLRPLTVPGVAAAYWVAMDYLPTVPHTPDQQAAAWGHTATYSFYVAVPRSTVDAGEKLAALVALLVARIGQLGYATVSPTDGLSR